MRALSFVAILVLCTGCLTEPDSTSLPRSTPEDQGISSSGIVRFLEEIDQLNQRAPGDQDKVAPEFHSLMIIRNGHVVAEGWWEPYSADRNHALFSLSKSFTSTAAGFAIEEGFFDLDDRVISFFPDKLPETVSPNLEAMTVRHLLTMSTGQSIDNRTTEDWVRTFLSLPVETEPGTQFRYSTSATFMVSAIIQETTGQTVMDFLTPRFFEPLGITGMESLNSPQGYNTGGYGKSGTTEDIAKLGLFYLQKGQWNGEQLLPASWIELATSKQIENASDPDNPNNTTNDWAQGYGFQFWQTTHDAYRGDGAYGQFALVLPEHNMVIAITGGSPDMQAMLNVLWDKLYPAIQMGPLRPDQQYYDILQEKLASLTLFPFPDPTHPAIEHEAAYALSSNDTDINTVSFNGDAENVIMSLKTETSTHQVMCGLQTWATNRTSNPLLPDNILSRALPDTMDVVANCHWADENTLESTWRLVNMPRALSITSHFEADSVRIERSWFNSRETVDLVLAGHSAEQP